VERSGLPVAAKMALPATGPTSSMADIRGMPGIDPGEHFAGRCIAGMALVLPECHRTGHVDLRAANHNG
jgi:hypothetical protein